MIAFILDRRAVILLLTVLASLGSLALLPRLPLDAFPDTTPVQVQVNAVADAMSAEEMERLVTMRIEQALGGLPGLERMRSISRYSLAQVTLTFREGTDLFDARQAVLERLNGLELPAQVRPPTLGAPASGLGEIIQYAVRTQSKNRSLESLRAVHDLYIRPQILTVPGVTEVTAFGGYEKTYAVVLNTPRMLQTGVTLDDLREAISRNNLNLPGGLFVQGGQAKIVLGTGRLVNARDIAEIVIRTHEGVPVRVGDVATVAESVAARFGAATADAIGEAVIGSVLMGLNENSRTVSAAVREKIKHVQRTLPEDVYVEILHDRRELVDEVLRTARDNLMNGALLVIAVLFLLYGNLRAAFISALAIPLSFLSAVTGMYFFGVAASLLSLGALDFGLIIDGSIVMTDANLRRITEQARALGRRLTFVERFQAVQESSRQVVRPIFFGVLIITLVFVPVLTLEGTEGKLFKPMAWTFLFALTGALIIALCVSPILSLYLLPGMHKKSGRISEMFTSMYRRLLEMAIRWRGVVIGCALVLLGITFGIAGRLGGEFLPRLREGAVTLNLVRLPGTSLEESVEGNRRIERLLLTNFPNEIAHVWSRIGAAEQLTDPMGMEVSDIFLQLTPRKFWRAVSSQDELVARIMDLIGTWPGMRVVATQPIEMRMNELTAGVRAEFVVYLLGEDLATLRELGRSIERILATTPGVSEVSVDVVSGQPALRLTPNPDALTRFGLSREAVLQWVTCFPGLEVTEVLEERRRIPVVLRLTNEPKALSKEVLEYSVPVAPGTTLRLADALTVVEDETVASINREWGRRVLRVQANVRGRDLASFADEVRHRIAENVHVPTGYSIEFGGQLEHLERAQRRLMWVVPAVLLLVFILLLFSLRDLRDTLIVYAGIPCALVGGLWSLYLREIPFSVSAAVGFIALAGIAVLNGQILVEAIRHYRAQGFSLRESVSAGAATRLRAVVATALTDALGFFPMALATGIGAEIQRPLATVVVAGVCSSTFLTLLLLPTLYVWAHAGMEGEEGKISGL